MCIIHYNAIYIIIQLECQLNAYMSGPVHASDVSIATPSLIQKYFLFHNFHASQRFPKGRGRGLIERERERVCHTLLPH